MSDKEITCSDCGGTFTFTEAEQEFYASKDLSEPKRCKDCRNARKSQRGGPKQMHDAVCSDCGADCQVPFEPSGDRPVLCRDCFAASRN